MQRTALALILALLISAVSETLFIEPVMAKTITVPDDYPTIQAAIGNATDGDTIFVKKGTYHESVTVDKTLTLTGEDSQQTIIIGELPVISQLGAIHVTADNVTISGFAIRDSDVGILIEDSYPHAPSGCRINGNDIVNNGEGIVARGITASITGNNIAGSGSYGIYVSSSNTIISGNQITGSGYSGMIVDMCKNVTISGNTITGNGVNEIDGPRELRGGVNLRWNGPFYVYGNSIADNKGYGIQFGEGCHNATIYDNSIERNSIGINLFNFVIAEGDATVGLGNLVYRNNLIDNSQQALVEKAYRYAGNFENYTWDNGTDIVSWDNGTVGNYWSDYQSKYPNAAEVDASGIGDTAYVIDENNMDNYPLMQPVDIFPASLLMTIAIVAVVVIVVVSAGLLIYFRKRSRAKINRHGGIEQSS